MSAPVTFEHFEQEVKRLVEIFTKNLSHYKSSGYDEASLRQEFLNPFFRALGWDVENQAGNIPNHREVEIESRTEIGGRQKRADYLFRTDTRSRFVCEAKKPAETLDDKYAFQAKRYAWNKSLPLAVLTDFEEIKIYIVGGRPYREDVAVGLWKTWHFLQFPLLARELWDLLSRDLVATGSIDRLLETLPKRAQVKGRAKQLYLIKPDRTRALDTDFLNFLDTSRQGLASDLYKHNDHTGLLEDNRLNEATQRILDRLLFLRICEDRDIDTGVRLQSILETWQRNYDKETGRRPRQTFLLSEEPPKEYGAGIKAPKDSLWHHLVRHFRALDRRPPSHVPFFNGNLFKPHFSEDLLISDEWLADFIRELSDDESPYLFNVIPVEILGTIYERFLGKVVRPHGRGVTIEEKPEVRKAGGVYYTPSYIVDYIVEQTIGVLVADKTPEQSLKLTILDPACGSGSFLIRAFERMCEHWQLWLTRNPEKRKKKWCWVETATGDVHLTVDLKRQILTQNIYGVDLDAAAVEVTQLSLYLKMLENENRTTLKAEKELFGEEIALLPPLEKNIKCFNSLIGSNFSMIGEDLVKVKARDWLYEFQFIMKSGGFDAVIGNPPYGAYLDESHKDYLNANYSFQSYQLDSYLLFLERSLRDLVRKNGIFGMIIPNPWLTNLLQTNTRRFVCDQCRIREIVHFKFPVFPGVTVDTQIVMLEKGYSSDWKARVLIVSPTQSIGDSLQSLPHVVLTHQQEKWRKLDGGVLNIFTSEDEEALAAKILSLSARLDSFCEINVGIKPYQTGKGQPKQTKETVQSRPFDSTQKISAQYRQYLRGSDIGRYVIDPIEPRFLKYGLWLAEPRPAANFDAPAKIVMRQTGDSIVAALDRNQFLCLNNMHVIVPKAKTPSVKFMLGLLNSRVVNWYYHVLNPEVGEALAEVKRTNVAQLPIRPVDIKNADEKSLHDRLVILVDKMFSLVPNLRAATSEFSKATLQNAITATDQQIDQLVYELYGLTPEEIALVEGLPNETKSAS